MHEVYFVGMDSQWSIYRKKNPGVRVYKSNIMLQLGQSQAQGLYNQ